MKTATKYIADDGTEFDNADACKEHEEGGDVRIVAAASALDIGKALAGSDADLADALKRLGNRCIKARRERGEMRRKPAEQKAAEPSAPPAEGPKKGGKGGGANGGATAQ